MKGVTASEAHDVDRSDSAHRFDGNNSGMGDKDDSKGETEAKEMIIRPRKFKNDVGHQKQTTTPPTDKRDVRATHTQDEGKRFQKSCLEVE